MIETIKRPGYYLVFYGMITLPAWGERHALARPTVLSCRHSREVTRRNSSWLTGIKAIQHYLTDPPPAISFTKTGPVAISGWRMKMKMTWKQEAHTVFHPSHTPGWFASTPPVRMVIQLTHNQSENPMAQTADSQPPQTLHVESEQTTSARLRKLPTQLNTLNRFVPDLVWVSPYSSDVQQLGQCVPVFRVEVFSWEQSGHDCLCVGKSVAGLVDHYS